MYFLTHKTNHDRLQTCSKPRKKFTKARIEVKTCRKSHRSFIKLTKSHFRLLWDPNGVRDIRHETGRNVHEINEMSHNLQE